MMQNITNFSVSDYQKIFSEIAAGKIEAEKIKDFLLELNEKYWNIGFPGKALTGAINAFRPLCKKVNAPKNAIDVCGTGGDKLNTLNISTASAVIVAACGVPVAKHGSKAISSKSGSADILSALGVNISAQTDQIEKSLSENNLCFIFAPLYHPAFKHVAQVRGELKVPTIFNFLGPLLNPAGVKNQLIGVSKREMINPMLQALKNTGSENVFIVHGFDGMDEITICDNSLLGSLINGKILPIKTINPENYGIKKVPLSAIKGGDVNFNKEKLLELLFGKESPYLDICCLNAAFALQLANNEDIVPILIQKNFAQAKDSVILGKAQKVLNNLIK